MPQCFTTPSILFKLLRYLISIFLLIWEQTSHTMLYLNLKDTFLHSPVNEIHPTKGVDIYTSRWWKNWMDWDPCISEDEGLTLHSPVIAPATTLTSPNLGNVRKTNLTWYLELVIHLPFPLEVAHRWSDGDVFNAIMRIWQSAVRLFSNLRPSVKRYLATGSNARKSRHAALINWTFGNGKLMIMMMIAELKLFSTIGRKLEKKCTHLL